MNTDGAEVLMYRIVQQYSDMLFRLAYSRLQTEADAEDCVQDVFMKLLEKQPEFRDQEHEKAWLIRVTINRASDLRRKNAKIVPLEELPEKANDEHPSILSAVRQLPDKYAAILHLRYYEGYTLKEISNLLALPTATVGTRLSRGKARLKTILEEEYDEF